MELDAGKTDYTSRDFGDLSLFVYCLLQKIKASLSQPVIEKAEVYMQPNRSTFPAIEEETFLEGTRVIAGIEKVSSFCLKSDFHENSRQFL